MPVSLSYYEHIGMTAASPSCRQPDPERDQEKHVPAKAGMEPGFPSDRATN